MEKRELVKNQIRSGQDTRVQMPYIRRSDTDYQKLKEGLLQETFITCNKVVAMAPPRNGILSRDMLSKILWENKKRCLNSMTIVMSLPS